MRLLILVALALLCSRAFADCKEASGGRFQGLMSPVIWHARAGCGDGTLIWFQTLVGKDGSTPEWRVDDLLIVPALERDQALSLLSPLDVECRHQSGRQSLAIAVGEWNRRAGQGERQHVYRAWRVDAESKKVAEVPIREVACVLR